MTAEGRALILCVDEYENILMGWKALLEQEGYQVLTAAGCNDAFRLFSSEPIDQVMLDSQLPGMPGDATRKSTSPIFQMPMGIGKIRTAALVSEGRDQCALACESAAS